MSSGRVRSAASGWKRSASQRGEQSVRRVARTVGARRGPNPSERTPGKGRGCQRARVTSVPRFGTHSPVETLPARVGFREPRSSARRPRSLQIDIEWRSPIVVGGFPVRRSAGRASARSDRPDAEGGSSRACSTRSESARRARREQAVRMDDRSPGHDLRSGSRCPEALESRSHLDSPGARSIEVSLRSAARAGDGGSAGRTPLLVARAIGPGSIRARERARSNQSEANAA